jgi:tRNA (guanine6-N2)-methyltransferase
MAEVQARLAVPRRAPPPQRHRSPLQPAGSRPRSAVLVQTVPGLEQIAADEIAATIPSAEPAGVWRHFDERSSLLVYRCGAAFDPWLALGSAEDVFALVAHARGLRTDRGGLGELAAATLSARGFDGALAALAGVRGRAPRSYRVVARKSGLHDYRRVDAQRAVEGVVRTRFPRLRRVADEADAEIWLTIIGREALLGVRLSTAAMRGRAHPFVSLPASLKPTVARAIVRLSEPRPSDSVLDPCCGAGTLLIERALVLPHGPLFAGDLDPAAAATARGNLRAAGIAAEVREWDALALPLADASVDVILTNPPFGKQIAIAAGDPVRFYAGLVAEFHRVLRPGGRLVLLTSQTEAFARAARRPSSLLRVSRRVPVLVRGERATIFVAEKA